MDERKHTPGPWLRDGRTVYALTHDGWRNGVEQFRNRFYANVQPDRECGEDEAVANPALIVRAVNSHDALIAALEDCKRRIEKSEHWWMDCPDRGGMDLEMIDAALALTKE